MGSHANFRRFSRRLIDALETPDGAEFVARAYPFWIRAMRSHEAYEERKLYPYLEKRWDVSMATASEGHEKLHALDEDVRHAFGDPVALKAALVEHDKALVEHLEVEEDLVIPLLLELSPEEFAEYATRSIHQLLDNLTRPTPARDS